MAAAAAAARRRAMARQIDGLKTELRELKAAMQEQGERFDELIEHLRGSQNL